jgi:hypothetical protein
MLSTHGFALSGVSVPAKKEMKCCAGKGSCHDKSQKNKDCGDSNCPSKDCHFQTVTLKIISETNVQEFTHPETIRLNLKNEFYLSPALKDLTYTFWHPPKYIS